MQREHLLSVNELEHLAKLKMNLVSQSEFSTVFRRSERMSVGPLPYSAGLGRLIRQKLTCPCGIVGISC